MLIFEEGFEGCSLGFTHSARWAAVGTAKLDDATAAPGSRASLSLFSGAPGNTFTQSGIERAWQGHTRPTRLRLYVRLAERQLAKAYVLLCHGSVFVDGALAAHFGSAAPSLLLRGTGGERASLLPGRLREGANALVFLVLARDAGPPEQEEVAVVTLARAEVILGQ